MKRNLILLAVVLIVVFAAGPVFSAGTETDWKLKMQFKMGSTSDVLDLTIGTASLNAQEELKPPPLPGKAVTDDPANAYVRAAILNAGRPAASKLIGVQNRNIWPIEIEAEEAGQTVSVNLTDVSDFYTAYYPIYFIVPGEATPIVEVKNGETTKNLYVSNGAKKTIFVVAGEQKSFAVASKPENAIYGMMYVPGSTTKKGFIAGTKVSLYDSNCNLIEGGEVTDETGKFEFSVSNSGNYIVVPEKKHFISTNCPVSLGTDYTAESCKGIVPGDFDENGLVSLIDLKKVKLLFGKTCAVGANEDCNTACQDPEWFSSGAADLDYNGDCRIDLLELRAVKAGFGTQNTSCKPSPNQR